MYIAHDPSGRSKERSSPAQLAAQYNYDYDYPNGLDLRPDTPLHRDLVSRLSERAHEARNNIQKRFDAFREMDRILTTYTTLNPEEQTMKAFDEKLPSTIVFPYSFAVMDTILSYLTTAFLIHPIFMYEGSTPDPNDLLGAIMIEKVVEQHARNFKVSLDLHTALRDSLAYGFGVVAAGWETQWGKRNDGVDGRVEYVKAEGNSLRAIDPYHFLPDPAVSIERIQDMEYVGWVETIGLTSLLRREQSEGLFNCKYLRHMRGMRSVFAIDQSDREEKKGGGKKLDVVNYSDPVDTIVMYVDLIPSEWQLGHGDYPEKWKFMMASDNLIIQAQPLDLNHNMYPLAAVAPEFDGHSQTPLSRMEVLSGLQGILDWLFNAHIANVRRAVNISLVVDPFQVNIDDIVRPKSKGGGVIRLRRPAWGKGVKDVVQQLGISDVTRQHIADSQWIVDWMQKVSGTDSSAMGSLRQSGPERLTKTEFQGTRTGALARLERMAMIISEQMFTDLGEMFAEHAIQFMTQEAFIQTTGRWRDVLVKEYGLDAKQMRMSVDPSQLNVNYDLVMKDGSIPGGGGSDILMHMFGMLAEHPELSQRFDITRIGLQLLREGGAKNSEYFLRVMNDEQVAKEAGKGNLFPMQEGGGDGQGAVENQSIEGAMEGIL